MTFARRPDWRARLLVYLQEVQAWPFAWGVHDCGTFAAGVVEAVTGADWREVLERLGATEHRDAVSAARYVRSLDADHVGAIAGRLFASIPVSQARQGDLVAFAGEGWCPLGTLGVVDGETSLVIGAEGLERTATAGAVTAYEVG